MSWYRSVLEHFRSFRRVTALVLILAITIVVPFVATTGGMRMIILGLIFGSFAISLNFQVGYGGLPSLGHAVFFGMGAYTVGLSQYHGLALGFGVVLILAASVAGGVALLIGPVALRARGVVFLMITLAASQVFWGVAMRWRSVTNGDDGLAGLARPELLNNRFGVYFLAAFALAMSLLIQKRVVESRLGWALRGTRDNELRARMLGVDVFRIQYAVYIISGAMAGITGAIYAYYLGFVGPETFSVATSGKVLLMVVLGGAATQIGPIIGAMLVEIVTNIGSAYTQRSITILGLTYVVAAVYLPGGLVPWFSRLPWMKTRRVRDSPAYSREGNGPARPSTDADPDPSDIEPAKGGL